MTNYDLNTLPAYYQEELRQIDWEFAEREEQARRQVARAFCVGVVIGLVTGALLMGWF